MPCIAQSSQNPVGQLPPLLSTYFKIIQLAFSNHLEPEIIAAYKALILLTRTWYSILKALALLEDPDPPL